ncbi:MAG: hypothetical protein ABIV93_01120 [Byssovorax sp.]
MLSGSFWKAVTGPAQSTPLTSWKQSAQGELGVKAAAAHSQTLAGSEPELTEVLLAPPAP